MGELKAVAGRWLGLDISSTTSGWAVVDAAPGGSKPRLLASGIVRMNRHKNDSIGLRLERLFDELVPILKEWMPARAALEAGYAHNSGTTTRRLAMASGVAVLVCHAAGVPVDEVPPSKVKKAIGGHGHAEKERMESAVRMLCAGCPAAFASDDESDAVSVALYGALILQTTECPI